MTYDKTLHRSPHMRDLANASRQIPHTDGLRSVKRGLVHTILDSSATTVLGWADQRSRRFFGTYWVARNASGFPQTEFSTLAEAALALKQAKETTS